MKDRSLPIPADLITANPKIMTEFDAGDDSMIAFVEQIETTIKNCEVSTSITLDQTEHDWLNTFTRIAYSIGQTTGDGVNANELAAWAAQYAVNEAFVLKSRGQSVTEPLCDNIETSNGPVASQMTANIDFGRKALFDGDTGFIQVTALDAYLSGVVPLYVISKYLTHKQSFPEIKSELSEAVFMKEFDQMAKAMILAEQPDIVRGTEVLDVRGIWSKLAVLTMDYWLRERAYPAFLFGNWALGQVNDTADYPSRWEKSSNIKIEEFTQAIPREIIADYVSVPKGILGTLQRALKDQILEERLTQAAGSGETDARYRIQYLATLVDRYIANQSQEGDEEILLMTFKAIKNLHDLLRAKVIINGDNLNKVVSAIAKDGQTTTLYLWRSTNGKSDKRLVTVNLNNLSDIDCEEVMNQWISESQNLGATDIYTGARLNVEVGGVNSELQIIRTTDFERNLASRTIYKALAK